MPPKTKIYGRVADNGGAGDARPAQVSPGGLLPRRRPRQARSRATVTAILEAAAQLIAESGFAAVSTNRIAERAGVSIGSLYQYFPNKDAILVGLHEQHLMRVRPIVMQSLREMADPAMPFARALGGLFAKLVELHRENPRLNRALAEEVPHRETVRRLHGKDEDQIVAQTETILRTRTDLSVKDPPTAAHVLVQTTEALSRWLVHGAPETLDRAAFVDEAIRMLCAYVQPPTNPGNEPSGPGGVRGPSTRGA